MSLVCQGEAGTEIVRFKIYLVFQRRCTKVGRMTKLRGNPSAVLVVVSLGFFMTLLGKTFPGAKHSINVAAAHDGRER